jgi:hypothetical protein
MADPVSLIRRAAAQLRAWQEKYGEFQPAWLPPAGDVRWTEDADAFLADHFCDGHCTWLDHHPDCVRADGSQQ